MQEEIIYFSSGKLSLEGRFAYDEDMTETAGKALICPPHPFLGGDMDNNVVKALNAHLVAAGFSVFRFNYRGIGQSESDCDLQLAQQQFWENSTCPDYEACIHQDCAAAMEWLTHTLDSSTPIFLLGYSFGCLPALNLSKHPSVRRLVLISPPLTKWKLGTDSFAGSLPRALCFATGDFACPEDEIESLYKKMPDPKKLIRFEEAEHFFIGQEAQLAKSVAHFAVSNDD